MNKENILKIETTCKVLSKKDRTVSITTLEPDQITQKRTFTVPVEFSISKPDDVKKEAYIEWLQNFSFYNVSKFSDHLLDILCETFQISREVLESSEKGNDFVHIDFNVNFGIEGVEDCITHGVLSIPELPQDFDINSLIEPLQQKIYKASEMYFSGEQAGDMYDAE